MKKLITIGLLGLFFTGFAGEEEKLKQQRFTFIKGHLSKTLTHYPKDKVLHPASASVNLILETTLDGKLKIVSIETEDPVLKKFIRDAYLQNPVVFENIEPGKQFSLNLLFK